MKRIILSVVIIAAIIFIGCRAIVFIESHNQRLYGMIEMVEDSYRSGEDVSKSISELESFVSAYERSLGCMVDDDLLGEMAASVRRLRPMLESGCDEFRAECETIRTVAKRILQNEVPSLNKLL